MAVHLFHNAASVTFPSDSLIIYC